MAEDKLKDKYLICKDCKRKFIYTIGEQKWVGQHGYKDPTRCRACRRIKKVLKLALEEGVSIKDNITFKEVCDKCGRAFYTTLKRKSGEKIYCDDCWTEIKYAQNRKKD